jgi:hypothetical protein
MISFKLLGKQLKITLLNLAIHIKIRYTRYMQPARSACPTGLHTNRQNTDQNTPIK